MYSYLLCKNLFLESINVFIRLTDLRFSICKNKKTAYSYKTKFLRSIFDEENTFATLESITELDKNWFAVYIHIEISICKLQYL